MFRLQPHRNHEEGEVRRGNPEDAAQSKSIRRCGLIKRKDSLSKAKRPRKPASANSRDASDSLGKLNYVLRVLIDQGWVKAGNFDRNPGKLSYTYLLTPSSIEAKWRN